MAAGPASGGPERTGLASEPVEEAPGRAAPDATADAGEGRRPPSRERRTARERTSFLRELPVLILIAFVLALLIKTFLVQAFFIPSGSMEPTLQIGDRVLVSKISYHLHPIHIGDIVVFSDPHPPPNAHENPVQGFLHWLTDGLGFTTSPNKDFIKRVIGLPGDTVEVAPGGRVFVNGRSLSPEPYVSPIPGPRYGPVTVPPGDLFVLGDNRGNSCDSRCSEIGFVPESKVIGRAFLIIWPPTQVRWLSTPTYTSGVGS